MERNLLSGKARELFQFKLSPHFHLIKKGTTHLFFDVNSLSLFKIDATTYEILSRLRRGDKIEHVLHEKGVGYDEFSEVTEALFKNTTPPATCMNASKPASHTPQEPVLEKLVLNVSNACNLACRYCYAQGGSYGQERSFMDKKVAIRTIDYFYSTFSRINNVQFFGGEPLLNPEIIQSVCAYVHEKKGISRLPAFGIVTNGTIMSPEILELLSSYDVHVTISIDGPKMIHDYLRGKGTFTRIAETIEDLRNNGIRIGVECTFTNYHLEEGFDVSDLMEFFYRHFGLHVIHIPFVAVPSNNGLHISKDKLIRSYSKAVESALNSLGREDYILDSFTLRLLEALVRKEKIEVYCPAGISTLTVSSKGDIYPCFMFLGNEEFLIGNVFEDGIPAARLSRISNALKAASKWNDCECRNCWSRTLCFGCLGSDYIVSGSIRNKFQCDFNRKIIESLLLNSCKILENPIAVARILSLRMSRDKDGGGTVPVRPDQPQ
jgi:uncharacterized protein